MRWWRLEPVECRLEVRGDVRLKLRAAWVIGVGQREDRVVRADLSGLPKEREYCYSVQLYVRENYC